MIMSVKLMSAIVWLCATLTVAGLAFGVVEQPIQSDDFVNSAGINVHLGYVDTLYYKNFPLVESSLRKLGIHHVRDIMTGSYPQEYYDRHNQLGKDGIYGLFTTQGNESSEALRQWPLRVPASFEG